MMNMMGCFGWMMDKLCCPFSKPVPPPYDESSYREVCPFCGARWYARGYGAVHYDCSTRITNYGKQRIRGHHCRQRERMAKRATLRFRFQRFVGSLKRFLHLG